MKYFLGGVNASGKTTLLAKIKETKPEFEIIKGSSALMHFLRIDGDYEALRNLSHEHALRELTLLMEGLFKKYDNFIFDAHYLNLVRGVIKDVSGSYMGGFDAIILLKVSAKTVLQRIERDHPERDRALFPAGISDDKKLTMLDDYIKKYEEKFYNIATQYKLIHKVLDAELEPSLILKNFIDFDNTLNNYER